MNDSLRRTLALAVVCLLVWGGWYGWQSWKTRQALEALQDVVRSTDLDTLLTDPPEEVKASVDLAVRGIRLSQGSEGRKSFDLVADWATLNQSSGAITVREPDIRYMMEDAADGTPRTVLAKSRVGRVEDGNQKVSMSDEVEATYDRNVITGDLAVFRNDARTLTFPGGAELDGPEISGTSNILVWNLNTNVLTGSHGVRMRWTPPESEASSENPSGPSDDAGTPSTDSAAPGAQEASQS